jgi:hypothetical protein
MKEESRATCGPVRANNTWKSRLSIMAACVSVCAFANARTVTNTNDSGAGSLRQAIADAVLGETIDFAAGVTGTIILTSGELVINKNLTIQGPGANLLTISANNASRVFSVTLSASGLVSFSGLTISGGNTNSLNTGPFGGGIEHSTGTVNVTNCVISGNTANAGGGLSNFGTMNVINSTVSGNHAGGGATATIKPAVIVVDFIGGGIFNDFNSTLHVSNSTISNNIASDASGGIFNSPTGTMSVLNSTVSGNVAPAGGGIFN